MMKIERLKNFTFFCPSRRGFTLTEVLLAVMIVALIGVALASLTRSSARESGVGRSKIMLRNSLSTFVRQLRKDLSNATRVMANGSLTTTTGSHQNLLKILQSASQYQSELPVALGDASAQKVSYCFRMGADSANIVPTGAYRGGEIYRLTSSDLSADYPACSASNYNEDKVVLKNVKYIAPGSAVSYPTPLFAYNNATYPTLLVVKLITELNATPVVNETIEQTFPIQGVVLP